MATSYPVAQEFSITDGSAVSTGSYSVKQESSITVGGPLPTAAYAASQLLLESIS